MESSTSSSPVTRIALLPVAVLLLFGLISQPVSATCYFPDGSTAEDGHKECSSGGTDATTCCADGMQCLTNGLCNDQRYENWGRVLRGACTNRDFGGGCNDVCRDLWPQGDEAVWYCGSGQYCCSRLNDCCNDSKFEKYILGEPTVLATAGVSARPTRSWLIASQSSTSSAMTTPSASPAPASSSSGGSSNGRTIGIAVGTVVGVLLLALIAAFFFIRRRRRTSQHTEITHELAGGPAIPPPQTDPKSAYEFDDKRGGWITTGAAGKGNVHASAWTRIAAITAIRRRSRAHNAQSGSEKPSRVAEKPVRRGGCDRRRRH
ncbi:hypothetical protein IQ07DRAFT_72195 [Pyrenochaeta sp. DS3sAY3a]|nr:hypothetical protein IQ07DRAFT_72195 [Pyrenochaeta sp. DS3sAY3a]